MDLANRYFLLSDRLSDRMHVQLGARLIFMPTNKCWRVARHWWTRGHNIQAGEFDCKFKSGIYKLVPDYAEV